MEQAVNMVTARIASRIFPRMLFNIRLLPSVKRICQADIFNPHLLHSSALHVINAGNSRSILPLPDFLFTVEYMFYNKMFITVRVPRAR